MSKGLELNRDASETLIYVKNMRQINYYQPPMKTAAFAAVFMLGRSGGI